MVLSYKVVESRRRLGSAGDVISMDANIADRYVQKGLLEPINSSITEEKDEVLDEEADSECSGPVDREG